jgi:hypothetical protein
VTDQGDAERRVEMVQKRGSQLGDAVTIGVAQQCDPVCVLGLSAGERLHPAGDDVLGPVNRRFRTVALDYQHVSIGKDVERPRMLKAGSQCMDLQSLRHRRSFVLSPSDNFCDPHGGIKYCCNGGRTGLAPICIFGSPA